MRNRQKTGITRDFTITPYHPERDFNQIQQGYAGMPTLDFNKIKIGAKTLDDAIFKLGDLRAANPILADKREVLRAIGSCDLRAMREISEYFYKISGIYSRILRYMAFMYCYDWMVTPYVKDEKIKKEKLLDGFEKCLNMKDRRLLIFDNHSSLFLI